MVAAYRLCAYGLDQEKAVQLISLNTAKILGIDNFTGSLEVGKAADFILLNDDIITTKKENILKVKVLQTFINGENVFSLKK